MDRIMQLFLFFTGKSYSFAYKVLSLIPGTIVFLGITPFILFHVSRYLSSFIPLSFPVSYEHVVAAVALFSAIFLMNCSMLILWANGKGTPAPIAPTQKLVTTGPYRYCRNPIELGTGGYFLFIGIWFDGLVTGLLCQIFGMILGYGYIKLIEERELALRFGEPYKEYLASTPLFVPSLFGRGKAKHD